MTRRAIQTQSHSSSSNDVSISNTWLMPRFRAYTVGGLLMVVALSAPAVHAEDWTQWGGPNGDFTVEVTGLADKWPEGGPKQLWKRPLGDGYSAILHKDDRLFTMYRDGEDEIVIALEANSGKTIWEHRYSRELWQDMSPNFGQGPNATPLIVDDRIISIGIAGEVRCLDLASGKLLWKHDLPTEFGRRRRVEEYGYSGIPLRYKETVIVQVGGDDHAVIAFNPADGSVVWKSDPGGISYAAPTVTTIAGQDHFIYFEPEGIVGLDASSGRLLWRHRIPVDNGNHLTPIVRCDDNHIWVSSQFTSGGGRLLEITRTGDSFATEEIWFTPRLRGSCWTFVRVGDFIYGSAGGHNLSFLAAFNWRTGKIAWRKRGLHMAQCLYADDKLLLLDQDGKLVIAKVTPEELKVLDTAQITESVSWTLPTLVSGKLYVRDRKHILALDISAAAN